MFIKLIGKGNEEWALGITGWLVSIPIFADSALSVPIFIVAILYSRWIGKKIYQIPNVDGTYDRKEFRKEYIKTMEQLEEIMEAKELLGLGNSLAPILVPLVLIFCKTAMSLTSIESGFIYDVVTLNR